MSDRHWRPCSACKESIALGGDYYVCNVSTCNRKRTGLVFCSVSCWEVHLPVANHRKSWAEPRKAPTTREVPEAAKPTVRPEAAKPREVRRVMVEAASPAAPTSSRLEPAGDLPREVLIIGSRLKDYVRARSGFNTSDRVLQPLSDIVRRAIDQAIDAAHRDGRKTVLDRDVPKR